VQPGKVDFSDVLIDAANLSIHIRANRCLVLRPLHRHEVRDGELQTVGTIIQKVEETADVLQAPSLALGDTLDYVKKVAGVQAEDGPRTGEKVGNDGGNRGHQRLAASSS
jgi:hypothetical protein